MSWAFSLSNQARIQGEAWRGSVKIWRSGCWEGEVTVWNKAGGTTHYTGRFREMYEAIHDCLTAISNNEGNQWISKTMTDAFGPLCAISNFLFIVAFQVNRCMFEYTICLSKLFQSSMQEPGLWISHSGKGHRYRHQTNCRIGVQWDLQDDCRDGQHCWDSDSDAKALLEVDHYKQRGTDTPEIYCRRIVFPPFLDYLLQESDTTFSALTRNAMLGLKFLPNNVGKLTHASIFDLQGCYCHEQLSPAPMSAEVRLWKTNGIRQKKQSSIIYNIICNVQLRVPKSFPHCSSTIHQDRLNALLRVRKDIKIDIKAIIDKNNIPFQE